MLTEQPFPEPSQDRQFKHKCLASPINYIQGIVKAGLKAISRCSTRSAQHAQNHQNQIGFYSCAPTSSKKKNMSYKLNANNRCRRHEIASKNHPGNKMQMR